MRSRLRFVVTVSLCLMSAVVRPESVYSGMEELVARARALTEQTLPATRKSAAAGDLDAQVVLGFGYTLGVAGLPLDNAKAAKEFEAAANRDHVFAQLMMAAMRMEGTEGVERNEAEAVRWLLKAAEHGNTEAYYMLGAVLRTGLPGVESNRVEALKWSRLGEMTTTNEGKRKAFQQITEVNSLGLTPEQVAQSERLAREWLAAHPK